jgi:hypothetical protein
MREALTNLIRDFRWWVGGTLRDLGEWIEPNPRRRPEEHYPPGTGPYGF